LSQRPSLPRVDISTWRSRLSMARAMRRAQSSAVMIFDCIMGEVPSGSPSGPIARLWISLTTKSGQTTLTSTPLPASSMRSESKNPIMACLLAE
jgi:hypothetical protein